MKKFALLFAAAFCLPVLGLTGCGGSTETSVIENTQEEEPLPDDGDMEAGMEAAMSEANKSE